MISSKLFVQGEGMAIADDVSVRNAIIKTLKYFHVFRHPLYAREIYSFLQIGISQEVLQHMLDEMVREESIFYAHNMYSLENSSQIFLKRLMGADLAAEKMKEAHRCAAVIGAFPFVKAIFVSGSLSKGYADERSDIDFFIVTEQKRLWIGRTLLHLFKKLTFLVNKQHSFCMNYFIDESKLQLEEKNIFTATELCTLIPVYGSDMHRQLIDNNKSWLETHFPNMELSVSRVVPSSARKPIKKRVEWIFNRMWPERLNIFLMKLTDKMWRMKWERKNYPMEDYDLAMKTKWYVSKHHPLNYQKKVLKVNNEESYQTVALGI